MIFFSIVLFFDRMVSNCRSIIVTKAGAFVKCCLPLLLLLSGCRAKDGICVITREEGSGTRAAFVRLTGVERDGIDRTTKYAETDASTAVVLQSVAGNPNAIGYISLANLCNAVKALPIEGIDASLATVRNGTYPLVRRFYLAGNDKRSAVCTDFLAFLRSAQAERVLAELGYAAIDTAPFSSAQPRGKLVFAGSSSVAPVIQALAAAYRQCNPYAEVQIQASDTASGLSALEHGLCALAMLSREPMDGEGGFSFPLCLDAIAVIVHPENPREDITLAQLCAIYLGEINAWNELE